MATVTVTGGEGKDSLLLTYNNGARNSAEAQSIASIIVTVHSPPVCRPMEQVAVVG
jgi:hypothetical protein